jgi:hypothetical protein
MNRLDAHGVLNDTPFERAHPKLAMDHALPPRVAPKPERRPAQRQTTFTVTTDTALRAAAEQRTAADHARETSSLARLIPGYYRLP